MGRQKFRVGDGLVYTMEKFDPNDPVLPLNEEIIGPEPDKVLVEGIRQEGIYVPLIFTYWKDELYLIDGGRRLKAARLLEIPEFNAQVFENLDPTDQKAISIIINDQRSTNLIIEYEYLAQLRDEDLEEFVNRTRLDRAHINKVMKLDELVPEAKEDFIEAYKAGDIAQSTLFNIAKKSPPRQKYLANILETKGKVTGTDVKKAQQASTTAVLAAADFLAEEVPIVPETEVPESIFALFDSLAGFDGEIKGPYFDWHTAFEESQKLGWSMYRLVEV